MKRWRTSSSRKRTSSNTYHRKKTLEDLQATDRGVEQDHSPGDEPVYREESEIENFVYEFNEIVVNELVDLDPQYVIDMETIKELLIEQQENLTGETDWLLQAKKDRHPEAYAAYKEALGL